MAFAGTYYGNGLIEISIEEYRRSRYISRCRIIDENPLRESIFVLEDEYRYAREKEARESHPIYYSATWIDQQTCATTCTTGTTTLNTQPIKKEEEKVSKQVRHQYLKKRLLERLNK